MGEPTKRQNSLLPNSYVLQISNLRELIIIHFCFFFCFCFCFCFVLRYAVVTGGNKGIGFEICRQLASNGVLVILTARDQNRGLEAVQKLKNDDSALSDYIIFHQLDVADSSSVSSLADFVRTQFGKLDILVLLHDGPPKINWLEVITDTYEIAVECLKINYYGAKQMTDAFLPLLELSDSPKIVNVSSGMGKLKNVKNEWAVSVFSDVESLNEEKIEQVLDQFLKDFKQGLLETEGWPLRASAYILSKAAMNAYTRMMANKNPKFCMNCVCPGYVKTDINFNTGIRSPEEGAKGPVKLALLSDGSPTGKFFDQTEEGAF
ncbi:(+)-neomenthol dehydrogenase [Linum perenne]